jgi:ankyrin repeat protein
MGRAHEAIRRHDATALAEAAATLAAMGSPVTGDWGDETLTFPLSLAAKEEALDCLAWLLEREDPNRRARDGRTALHHAVASGSDRSVKMLLAHGAGAQTRSVTGKTPLDLALGMADSIDSIRARGGRESAVAICDALVAAGEKIKPGPDGVPLVVAWVSAMLDKTKGVKNALEEERLQLLMALAKATDRKARAPGGRTALALLAQAGCLNAVMAIVPFCDVNVEASQGHTALNHAMMRNDFKMMDVLLPHHDLLGPLGEKQRCFVSLLEISLGSHKAGAVGKRLDREIQRQTQAKERETLLGAAEAGEQAKASAKKAAAEALGEGSGLATSSAPSGPLEAASGARVGALRI